MKNMILIFLTLLVIVIFFNECSKENKMSCIKVLSIQESIRLMDPEQ